MFCADTIQPNKPQMNGKCNIIGNKANNMSSEGNSRFKCFDIFVEHQDDFYIIGFLDS